MGSLNLSFRTAMNRARKGRVGTKWRSPSTNGRISTPAPIDGLKIIPIRNGPNGSLHLFHFDRENIRGVGGRLEWKVHIGGVRRFHDFFWHFGDPLIGLAVFSIVVQAQKPQAVMILIGT